MKIYQVVHRYDVDGEFGDAVTKEKVVAVFESKDNAEDFVEKYQDPHVYAKPYAELECGWLDIRDIDMVSADEYEKWEQNYDASNNYWIRNKEIRYRNYMPKVMLLPEEIEDDDRYKRGWSVLIATDDKSGFEIRISSESNVIYILRGDYVETAEWEEIPVNDVKTDVAEVLKKYFGNDYEKYHKIKER